MSDRIPSAAEWAERLRSGLPIGSDVPYEPNEIVLSTGKTLYANGGIIGLGPDGIYEGYDGVLWSADDKEGDLTRPELIELADRMIERWAEFRQELGP